MRFALIGIDDLSRTLVHALAQSPVHSLVATYLSRAESNELAGWISHLPQTESWESLLARRDVDAVLVASGGDPILREEQLKRLVQGAIPLVVVHPACDVMFAYELEMMRREAGGVIVPIAPHWWHPGMERLVTWCRQQTTPQSIEQVNFQRSLVDRRREPVLHQFVRDAWPIRRLIGPIQNVSAVGASNEDPSLSNLSVHCSGENEIRASWSVVSPTMDPVSKLSIIAANEIATLHIPDGDVPWTFESRGAHTVKEQLAAWNPGEQILERIQQAVVAGQGVPSWSEACLDLEAAESVGKSLRRKRAVDLHTAEASEDQTFKGFMAAAGCLILTIVLLGFLVLAVFEGFRMPLQDATPAASPDGASKWPLAVRLWPVYPLVAFLLMQFLLLLAKRPARKPPSSDTQQVPGDRSD